METPVLIKILSKYLFLLNIKHKTKFFFMVLITMFVVLHATSQVIANFTTTTSTNGCGSLLVEFEDLSLGNPTSWLWDFGNGNTSTLKEPTTIYSIPGLYDVKLTVSDSNSIDTKTILSYIEVYQNPLIQLEAPLTTSGCIPFSTNFEAILISNTPISTWQWDFGDGGNSIIQNPNYIFHNEGEYSVSVFVTDINGCENLITESNLIEVNKLPIANFISDITFSCDTSELVSFTNNSNYASEYLWDFGDGSTSNQFNPNHNYLSGIYDVTLYAKEGNCIDTLIVNNLIEIGGVLSPDFTINTSSGCQGLNVSFLDITTNNPNTFLWDFGDGNTSTLQNPTHTYNNPGIYDITLSTSISGNCLQSSIFLDKIEVFEDPIVSFKADTTYSCIAPFTVNFTDITFDAISWNWNFGNGQTSNNSNSLQMFNNFGFYDITLTVQNSKGCTASKTELNYINVEKIDIEITTSDSEGCVPLTSNFYDNTFSTIPIVSWNWTFGDGNTSQLQNPIHTYNYQGSYDVSLMTINAYGCLNMVNFSNFITTDYLPNINFTASPIIACVGEEISFTDLSSQGTNFWHWSFGDGSFSNLSNPTHHFESDGLYDINLIAGKNSCLDTITFNEYIKIIEPVALFEENYNCNNPLTVEFLNQSIGSDSIFWDFGDGTTSLISNPTHTFLNLGIHYITLYVTNNLTGCTHTITKEIELTKPIASFDYLINSLHGYQDSVGCNPKQVYIDNQSQDCHSYTVIWSDDNITHDISNHTLTEVGNYDVTLIASDIHDCKDTITINNMYNIYDVSIDFEIGNILGCDSILVNFIDLTTPNSSNLIWDFGDGTTSTINNAEHIYYNEGLYDVTLYAESIHGCRDTLKKEEYINFQYPNAEFNSSNQSICSGDTIEFLNLSSGTGLTNEWIFGDGSTSNSLNPIHTFMENGLYSINLIITDSFGCSDNLMLNNHILVQTPTANFSTYNFSSDCPPLISNFDNLSSSDANIFKWNFGDGNSSIIENPSHLFTSSGSYNISLIVENSIGCKDTLIQNNYINILGPTGSFTISDKEICKNDSIYFLPHVLNTNSFLWDFGNGITSNDTFPSVAYNTSGRFIPSLILEDSIGCQYIVPVNDTINVNEVIIDAGINKEICQGDSVQLNAIGEHAIFTWYPSIGLSNPNVSNPIANPNTSMFYYVTHTDGFCSEIDSLFVYVHNNIPNANFSTTNLCEGDTTSFLASSGLLTTNNNYIWSFGQNGQFVNSVLNVGNNNITLIVENLDNNCKDSISKNIEIIQNPVADFLIKENKKCLGETFNFINNSSLNSNIFLYDFGDNIGISISKNTNYNYLIPGNYQVKLNVISDEGCKDSIVKEVIVYALPEPNFLIENNCEEIGNTFIDISNVENSKISLIEYSFNNDIISKDSIANYIFDGYGFFDVKLTATSLNGCKQSITKTTEVYPNPIAIFTADQFCEGDTTKFTNYSYVENGNIVLYNWIFELERFSNLKDPKYIFTTNGVFDINLTVLSEKGCIATKNKKIEIYRLPIADFEVPENICFEKNFAIKDLSIGFNSTINNWKYNFGDGNVSNNQNPTHNYININTYDISLEVINLQGCKHDTTKSSIIQVHKQPIADFQPSKLFASELFPTIHFYNFSQDAVSYIWNFDNGDYAYEKNPEYTFNNIQDYNIKLTAISTFGCSSSITKNINIHPEHTVYIPSAFSPNDDGLNDIFEVKGKGIILFTMQIYDKWGGIIFETTDINLGWNGKDYLGNNINQGIYPYHVVVHDHNSKPWIYSGEIKLMR